jgi:HEAT repeat protein
LTISLEEVRKSLKIIDPDPNIKMEFGSDALPHLRTLLHEEDTFLASQAVYALSLMKDPEAVALLDTAARDSRPEVRVAVAACSQNLSPKNASKILLELLDDPDVGVRKKAVRSAPKASDLAVRDKIEKMVNNDPSLAIRRNASIILLHIKKETG